jgi:hypothetical protein
VVDFADNPATSGSNSDGGIAPPQSDHQPPAFRDGTSNRKSRWPSRIMSFLTPASKAATTKREAGPNESVLGKVIPIRVGEGWVPGRNAVFEPFGEQLWLKYVFCRGELAEITEIEMNGDLIGSKTSWNTGANFRHNGGRMKIHYTLGTTSQTAPSWWPHGDEATPGRVCLFIWMNLADLETVPTSITVRIKTTGQKFYDFRDDTWKVSANPALITYHLETSHVGKWNSADAIDIPSWTECADWWDEAMADGSKRFEYRGLISDRDTDRAQQEVLRHGFGRMVPYGGKVFLVADKPAPALGGTWTATDSTTLVGTGGNATSKLIAGSGLLLPDGSVAVVATTPTDDNQVEVAEPVTIAGAVLLIVSSTHLTMADSMASVPRCTRRDSAAIADIYRVKFRNAETEQEQSHSVYDRSNPPSAASAKVIEVPVTNCPNLSQAERTGHLRRKLEQFAPRQWSGQWTAAVANLLPGDICRGSFGDGTDKQLVRVVDRTDLTHGGVAYVLDEYDPAATSDDTMAEDTPPSVTLDPPDPPTGYSQQFVEVGDFGSRDLLGDSPHNLSDWSHHASGVDVSERYSGGENAHQVSVTSGSGWLYLNIDSALPDDADLVRGYLLAKQDPGFANTDGEIEVSYSASVNPPPWPGIDPDHSVLFRPESDSDYSLYQFEFRLDDAASGHQIAIRWSGVSAGWLIKAVRLVAAGVASVGGGRSLALPDMRRRVGIQLNCGWTEGVDAATTVASYRLRGAAGGTLAEVPVGNTRLSHLFHLDGVLQVPVAYDDGSLAASEPRMEAVGRNHQVVGFPTPTQEYVLYDSPPSGTFSRATTYANVDSLGTNYTEQSYSWTPPSNASWYEFVLYGREDSSSPWQEWIAVPASSGLLSLVSTWPSSGSFDGLVLPDGWEKDLGLHVVRATLRTIETGAETVQAISMDATATNPPPTQGNGDLGNWDAANQRFRYTPPSSLGLVENPMPEGETLQAAGPGPGPHDLIGLSTTGVEVGDGDLPLELTGSEDAPTYNGDAMWHAGNDGAGSGLDADTLDGLQAAAFADASHNHDGTYAEPGDLPAGSDLDGWVEGPLDGDTRYLLVCTIADTERSKVLIEVLGHRNLSYSTALRRWVVSARTTGGQPFHCVWIEEGTASNSDNAGLVVEQSGTTAYVYIRKEAWASFVWRAVKTTGASSTQSTWRDTLPQDDDGWVASTVGGTGLYDSTAESPDLHVGSGGDVKVDGNRVLTVADEGSGNGLDADTLDSLEAAAFALVGHDHDSDYAGISHDHDSDYAAIGHDHDADYADISHNHTGVYAAASHTHGVSDIASIPAARIVGRANGAGTGAGTALTAAQVIAALTGGLTGQTCSFTFDDGGGFDISLGFTGGILTSYSKVSNGGSG